MSKSIKENQNRYTIHKQKEQKKITQYYISLVAKKLKHSC